MQRKINFGLGSRPLSITRNFALSDTRFYLADTAWGLERFPNEMPQPEALGGNQSESEEEVTAQLMEEVTAQLVEEDAAQLVEEVTAQLVEEVTAQLVETN